MSTTSCKSLQALANAQHQSIRQLNHQFNAWRRMAELMERAANPATLVPDLDQLIPVADFDTSAYDAVNRACGFGWPDAGAAMNEKLNSLKGELNKAYTDIRDTLENSAFGRLDRFKRLLDRLQFQVGAEFTELQQYLDCAASTCTATNDLGMDIRQAKKDLAQYKQDVEAGPSSIINQAAGAKRTETREMVDYIEEELR